MPVHMKQVIAETFAQMAQAQPIDKITVTDLVEQCGISRQAFYYHFQDILDVMEWSIRQMLEAALKSSLQAETPQKAIQEYVRMAVKHSDLMLRLLGSQRREQVEHAFVDAMRSSLQKMICSKRPDLMMRYQDFEVNLCFAAYGMAGVIFENCRKPGLDEELLSQQLLRLLSAMVEGY